MELELEMAYRMASAIVLFNVLALITLSSQAAVPDYYTVREAAPKIQNTSLDPLDTLTEVIEVSASRASALSLLDWEHHKKELQDPAKPYNRLKHYGPWANERDDGTCYNTRAKVLINQSEVPVQFSRNGCTVVRGKWQDPYTDRQLTDAMDVQIDHVVPLKNSYISGGWKWDAAKRCLYANFLHNDFHLLAVNGNENMQKGDRTPAAYMPPNKAFACEYLANWLKIKLIWNLAMTPTESNAITALVEENHCKEAQLTFSAQELRQQRQSILDHMDLCRASE